jgi:hypothetical protein
VTPVTVDLVAAHEALLGQTLASLARTSAAAGSYDVDRPCAHVLEGLRSSSRAYAVRLTSTAVAGDGAMYSPYRFMYSTHTIRQSTALDRRTFDLALASRETVRGVQGATVTHQSGCMMYSAGLDNRSIMPPFIPLGANEDGLFGAMLRLIEPRSFLGLVPVGIVHDSRRSSTYDGEPMPCASQLRLAEAVFALLHDTATDAVSARPQTHLRQLGQHLIDRGKMDGDDFAAHMATASLDLWTRERDRLDTLAASMSHVPSFWTAGLKNYRRRFLERAARPDFFVPIEMKGGRSVGEGFRRTQAFLEQYGQLLRAWPEIWSIARADALYRQT